MDARPATPARNPSQDMDYLRFIIKILSRINRSRRTKRAWARKRAREDTAFQEFMAKLVGDAKGG